MGQRRIVTVPFPMKGLNRRWAYGQQSPDTAYDILNVRPDETAESRTRGGTRPGIIRPYPTQVGADEVRLLSQVRAVPSLQAAFWLDEFDAFSTGGLFQNPLWSLPLGPLLDNEPIFLDVNAGQGVWDDPGVEFQASAVRAAIGDIDLTATYSVRANTLPFSFPPLGKYFLYVGLDDTTPDITRDAVVLEWDWSVDTIDSVMTLYILEAGLLAATISANVAVARLTPHLMTLLVEPGSTQIRGFIDGAEIVKLTGVTFPLVGGGRVGFSLHSVDIFQGAAYDDFVVSYTSTAAAVQVNRNYLVAGANGGLKRENTAGDDLETAASGSAADIVVTPPAPQQTIQAADYLGKLYIADHDEPTSSGTDGVIADSGGSTFELFTSGTNATMGDDMDINNDVVIITGPVGDANLGTYKASAATGGTITLDTPATSTATDLVFRVERAPKVYDPVADTMVIYYNNTTPVDVTNQPPTGCIVIGTHMDRVVLAGGKNNPQVWFMSKRGDPFNWDFSQTNEGAAVAGDDSNAGQIGAPITAMIPSIEDYLLFGSLGSLWLLRGDPTVGGRMDNLSRRIGCVGTECWCYGPDSSIFFLSRDGLYTIPPGSTSYPQSVSEEVIPETLKNIDNLNTHVMMEYDVLARGIQIHLTKLDSGVGLNYWFDLEIPGFWPFLYIDTNHAPFVTVQYEADKSTSAHMIMGGRDGFLRRYSKPAAVDDFIDQKAIVSYVVLGPIPLGSTPDKEGMIQRLEIILGRLSNPVTWKLYVANTAEDAIRKMREGKEQKLGTTRVSPNRADSLLTVHHPRARDYYAVIRIENANNDRWWFEQLVLIVRDLGKHRTKTVTA